MANHVTTVIEGPAEVLSSIVRGYTDDEIAEMIARLEKRTGGYPLTTRTEAELREEKIIDFGLIIPQPENIERGGCTGKHEPGVVCWYTWNIENWGTKWGAYDAEIGDETLKFDTAWSHPLPIIRALAKKFPDATLKVRYADEDLGYNLGEYMITGDLVWSREIPEGSNEARDFAAQLKHGMTYDELQAEWGE